MKTLIGNMLNSLNNKTTSAINKVKSTLSSAELKQENQKKTQLIKLLNEKYIKLEQSHLKIKKELSITKGLLTKANNKHQALVDNILETIKG